MITVSWKEAAERIARGEVGVIPTDTVYGIVASALAPEAVRRVDELRRRDLDKPFIVLIAGLEQLAVLQIEIDQRTKKLCRNIWPGPVSVIVAHSSPELAHVHRNSGGQALRLPAKPELVEFLKMSGPLVAPSANFGGEKPARTAEEAYAYFGDEVFYVDGGYLEGSPSALIDARENRLRVLRPAPGFYLEMVKD